MILSLISVKITVGIKWRRVSLKNVIFVAYSFMFTIKERLFPYFTSICIFLVYF